MYSAKAIEDEQIIEKNVFKLILHSMVYNSNVKKINPNWQKADQFQHCSKLHYHFYNCSMGTVRAVLELGAQVFR